MDDLFEAGLDLVRESGARGPVRPWQPTGFEAAGAAPGPPEEEGATPPPLRFDEDELARAMAAACAELRDRLQAAWAAAEAERLSHETARLCEALARIATVDDEARRETRRQLARLLATALRRLVPVLLERLEEPHLMRLLDDWVARLLPEEPVRVYVRPAVRDRLAARFEARGGEARLEFLGDPALPPGGLRLERAEGRIHHRPDELLEGLIAALHEVLDPSVSSTSGREEKTP